MCLIVKIAANCPLPTTPVDPERRRIAVLDLNNWPGDDSYTRWMTLPYVYEVDVALWLRLWPPAFTERALGID